MPFGNPIVGGTTLVRPAIKSPNFVAGASGWQIAKDGSAEFNNIVIRGGTTTQGVILMYNGAPASGNLIGSIAATGGTDTFGNTYSGGFNFGRNAGARFGIDNAGNTYLINNANQGVIIGNPAKGATLTYTSSPALGNLIISVAAVAGNDSSGNAFSQGITVQNGGTVTAKDTAGNTAVLTGNIPGGGLLGANPGMAMQPVRNTGDPATIGALDPGGPLPVDMALLLTSPSPVVGGIAGTDYAQIYMNSPNGPVAPRSQSGVAISATHIDLNGTSFASNGLMAATNRITGTATITPVAGVPTSLAVTFPALTGTSFSCQVTPGTSVPGSQVTGVGYTALTSTGVTLWINRTNTTATVISYTVEGH